MKKNMIITILAVLVIGLGGFIIYDKAIDKGKTKENNTEETTNNNVVDDTVTFTDSELQKYVNYISPVSIGPSALIYSKSEVKVSNMSGKDKIEYVGSKIFDKQTSYNEGQNYYYNIEEKDVKNIVEEIYGPNTYEQTTFNFGCGEYILNNGKYTVKTGGCGGASPVIVSNVIIDYKATKSKLEITTAYAFFNGSTNMIYKDINGSIPLTSFNSSDMNEINLYLNEYVKTNKDKLYHIVYTFESKDGRNYYFKEFINNK